MLVRAIIKHVTNIETFFDNFSGADGGRPQRPHPGPPPDLNKYTTQTSASNSQLSARPGLPTGGREPAEPPRLEDPSTPFTNVSLSSYASLRPQIPDRLDRTSMSNQPHDTPQFTLTQPSQQPPYMNRVNEPSGLYGPPPPPRLGPQPMDISSDSSKLGMNQSSAYRNTSMGQMDSAPHSGPMDTGNMSSVGMGQDRGRDPFRRSQMPQQRQMNPSSNNSSFQQAMSDHFDHYKRPPSRGSSIDRYGRDSSRTRGRTPELVPNPHSRAQSRQRTPQLTDTPIGPRGASNPALDAFLQMDNTPAPRRGGTPQRFTNPEYDVNESVSVGGGAGVTSLEDATLRHRGGFAQDIPTVPYSTPKRTESLFLNPQAAAAVPTKPTPMPKVSLLTITAFLSSYPLKSGVTCGATDLMLHELVVMNEHCTMECWHSARSGHLHHIR